MYEKLFKQGIAVGESDIKTDTMTFRWNTELFHFPTLKVFHLAKYNGYWYEADVKELRKLVARKRNRLARKGARNGVHKGR